nr:type II toxin-antitoxin system VapB family antitoxin [Conexibacter arvalis]
MNIKNDETQRLAREVASLTGESMTAAVTTALRERRDRLLAAQPGQGAAERMLAIGRDVASRVPAEVRALDHGALLYDADGLPR